MTLVLANAGLIRQVPGYERRQRRDVDCRFVGRASDRVASFRRRRFGISGTLPVRASSWSAKSLSTRSAFQKTLDRANLKVTSIVSRNSSASVDARCSQALIAGETDRHPARRSGPQTAAEETHGADRGLQPVTAHAASSTAPSAAPGRDRRTWKSDGRDRRCGARRHARPFFMKRCVALNMTPWHRYPASRRRPSSARSAST